MGPSTHTGRGPRWIPVVALALAAVVLGRSGDRPSVATSPRRGRRRGCRWWLYQAGLVSWVLLVGVIVVPAFVSITGPVGPGSVVLEVQPSVQGESVVELGPLGSVTSSTHASPVRVVAWVQDVEIVGLDAYAERSFALVEEISDDITALVVRFSIRLLVVSAVAGAVAGAAWPGRGRVRRVALGAVVLPAVAAGALAWTVASFDVGGVQQARFAGPVEQAPKVLEDVTQLVEGYGQLSGRLEAISGRLASLYSALGTSEVVRSDGEVVILHVSDLHLNPVGVELAAQLAAAFDVDAVLDTGDTTSFGTPPEAGFIAALGRVDAPYFLVPGNHDGGVDLTSGPLGVPDNVQVLDAVGGQLVEVEGLTMAAFADPTSESAGQTAVEQARLLAAQRAQIDRFLAQTDRVDVVAVHNPAQALAVRGRSPVVVAGHTHEFALGAVRATTIAVTGSTGAGGLGGLAEGDSYQAQLLRFVEGALVAVDQIDAEGLDGGFSMSRHLTTDVPDASLVDRLESLAGGGTD
jgi:predicted MPP superfamily phosphohydrolase